MRETLQMLFTPKKNSVKKNKLYIGVTIRLSIKMNYGKFVFINCVNKFHENTSDIRWNYYFISLFT